jgi:hypothetical protein
LPGRLDCSDKPTRKGVVIGGGVRIYEPFVDDVDCHLARDFTRCRSAHSITYTQNYTTLANNGATFRLRQTAGLLCQVRNKEVIFVVFAYLTDIGPAEHI